MLLNIFGIYFNGNKNLLVSVIYQACMPRRLHQGAASGSGAWHRAKQNSVLYILDFSQAQTMGALLGVCNPKMLAVAH